jgi:nicotinate phosphoribosyltransferase
VEISRALLLEMGLSAIPAESPGVRISVNWSNRVSHHSLALFTDLYELTMAQAYYEEGMTEKAVFSLFARRLPRNRNYLLACGIGTVLEYLENLHFDNDDIEYLACTGELSGRFLDELKQFHFTGNIRAVPEGTPIFADEPILEVEAPIIEAQIAETLIMNQIHVQTLLASKARRVVTAARGRAVVDFGTRRMQGIDAALKAARAFYIGGVAATSNVMAGKLYGLPVTGTMAHSYIQAHEDELDAFRKFVRSFPETVLLVDTYDTLEGVRKVVKLAEELGKDFKVTAVRLDSGDLLTLSKETRSILDGAGLENVEVFASGGLDEAKIALLLSAGAPIDGFGVGTNMGVSEDAPSLDIAYKLCEYAGKGRLKLSTGKPILPGPKQVFRETENDHFARDIIARADEELRGKPLLELVMRDGRTLDAGRVDIESTREYTKRQVSLLPDHVRANETADPPYPVEISDRLRQYQNEVEGKTDAD